MGISNGFGIQIVQYFLIIRRIPDQQSRDAQHQHGRPLYTAKQDDAELKDQKRKHPQKNQP